MDEQAIVKLVPSVNDSDADSVKMSLEAARALALSGEPEEALRLVRRAAEAAEQAGDDMRSIQLARAAADIANEVERAKKGGDGGDQNQHPPGPASRPPRSAAAAPATPASNAGPAPHSPSPPSNRAALAPSSKSSPQAAPPPDESAAADAPAAPAAAHSGSSGDHAGDDDATRSNPKDAPASPEAQLAERSVPASKKADARPAPAALPGASVPPAGMSELLAQGRAVRVLVKRSARDESLYIVRPYANSHVPVGAREAFLVLGDADPEFLAGVTR